MPRKRDKKSKHWTDYIFALVVGSTFLFSLTRTIFSATFIEMHPLSLYAVGFVAILVFMVVTYNWITRSVAGVSFFIFVMYGLNALRTPPYRPYDETYPRVIEHLYRVGIMALGYLPYEPELGRTTVWLVSLALAFIVVVFLLNIFSFYVPALTGIAVFAITWAPGFYRDEFAFLIFLFAICVILIRKLNRSASATLVIVPLCALVVFFSQRNMPTESNAFVGRPLTQFVSETIEDIGDLIFELFNPTYFSFATTGFSGRGGTLGGPVNPNARPVMEVRAPGGTYLAGVTHNIYTGNRWVSNLQEGDIYTHGLPHGQFEMLEAFASLLRGATLAREESTISLSDVRSLFRVTPAHNIAMGDFEGLRITHNGGYYLHTYMPTTAVYVNLGRRRTGTVFRPNMAWDLGFAPTGGNYLHTLNTLPAGDLQAPRLMSRNTAYEFQFLNVNQNLPFIRELLREADSGIYERRAAFDGSYLRPHHVTFYGVVEGLIDIPEGIEFPEWGFFWPDIRGYGFITANVEWYYYYGYDIFFWFDRLGISVLRPQSMEEVTEEEEEAEEEDEQEAYEFVGVGGLIINTEFINPGVAMGSTLPGELPQNQVPSWPVRPQPAAPAHHVHFGDVANADDIIPVHFFPFSDQRWHGVHMLQPVNRYGRMDLTHFGLAEMQFLLEAMLDPFTPVFLPTEADLLNILDAFTANVLEEYARQVRAHFMDVPEIVPQRVHDLTHEIIRYATNDFDRIMAIRNYLLQFPYTLDTVPVPRGVCFVDHFLFYGQQGYCVYFASAMAIMARIAGVPSRYVEGFVTPATYTYRELTMITNMMAHAWVEVYLEGFGWLKVEATPTYAYLMAAGFPVPLSLADRPIGDWWDDYYEWWYYEEMMLQALLEMGLIPGMPGMGAFPGLAPVDGGGGGGGIIDELQERINPIVFAIAIPSIAITAVVVYLLFLIFRIKNGIKKVRRLDASGQIIAYFAGILDVIAYSTVPIGASETPLGYGKHQGKRFTFRSDSVNFGDLINLYYRARYSQHDVKEAERALMEEAYYDMIGKLKWQNTRTNFWRLRYIQRVGAIGLSVKAGDKNVTLRQEKVTI